MLRVLLSFTVILGVLGLPAPQSVRAEDASATADAFFAGTVTGTSSAKLTVARVVRNQTESRSFKVTPQTKFEGKVANNVRVTVRYISDDDGDTATLVVVRPPVPAPPQKSKK